jgi:hypothetical protein
MDRGTAATVSRRSSSWLRARPHPRALRARASSRLAWKRREWKRLLEPVAPEIEMPIQIAAATVELPTLEVPTLEMPNIESAMPAAEPTETVTVEVAVQPETLSTPEPIARMTLRGAIPVPPPVAVTEPEPTVEPRLSLAGIANELLGALGATSKAAPVADDTQAADETPAPAVPAPAKPVFTAPKPAPATKPAVPAAKPAVPGLKPITPDKPIAPAPNHIAPVAKPTVAAPKPGTPAAATTTPAAVPSAPAAKPAVATTPTAVKPAAAVAPAAAAPAPKPAATETPAQNLPQEFEGLKFPNDGVLTRQWMEFLNQMASSK